MAETDPSRPSQALPPTNTNNYNNSIHPTSSQTTSSPTSDQGLTQDPSSSSQSEAANEVLPPYREDDIDEDDWPDEEPYEDPDEPGEDVDNEEDYEGNIPPRLEEKEGDG